MLKEGSFEVNYLDVNQGEMGLAESADSYTSNYYLDYGSRSTMCCNCDKAAAQFEQ